MANESTAIVSLIDLVKTKPLASDAGDDDLFGGKVRFDPTAMPVSAQPVMLPEPQAPGRLPKGTAPPPFGYGYAQDRNATTEVSRSPDYGAIAKKLALPVGIFVLAMIGLAVYLAKSESKPPVAVASSAPETKAMPIEAAAPSPQAAATVTPIEAPKAAAPTVTPIEPPAPIDPPAPAQVGTTTIESPVKADRFAAAAEPTVPTATDVANDEPAEAVEAAPEPAKVTKKKKRDRRAAKRAKRAKQREARVAVAEQPAPKAAKSEKLGGKASLSISSATPREIWVNGRNTKQMTPKRIVLAPGNHNITLFDKKTRAAKTFQVDLKPNQSLKVSK